MHEILSLFCNAILINISRLKTAASMSVLLSLLVIELLILFKFDMLLLFWLSFRFDVDVVDTSDSIIWLSSIKALTNSSKESTLKNFVSCMSCSIWQSSMHACAFLVASCSSCVGPLLPDMSDDINGKKLLNMPEPSGLLLSK